MGKLRAGIITFDPAGSFRAVIASRSAEAAKEIKTIVENATIKANFGKSISGSMIEGYKELSKKIDDTISLISNIKDASKEQEVGIHQINDAVNQFEKNIKNVFKNSKIFKVK